jgi:hypothetical protein
MDPEPALVTIVDKAAIGPTILAELVDAGLAKLDPGKPSFRWRKAGGGEEE